MSRRGQEAFEHLRDQYTGFRTFWVRERVPAPVALRPPGLRPERRACSVAVSANLWPSLGADAGRHADPVLAGRLRRKQVGAMEALEADVSRRVRDS